MCVHYMMSPADKSYKFDVRYIIYVYVSISYSIFIIVFLMKADVLIFIRNVILFHNMLWVLMYFYMNVLFLLRVLESQRLDWQESAFGILIRDHWKTLFIVYLTRYIEWSWVQNPVNWSEWFRMILESCRFMYAVILLRFLQASIAHKGNFISQMANDREFLYVPSLCAHTMHCWHIEGRIKYQLPCVNSSWLTNL